MANNGIGELLCTEARYVNQVDLFLLKSGHATPLSGKFIDIGQSLDRLLKERKPLMFPI